MTEGKLNPFVYEACEAAGLSGPEPGFPVRLSPQYAQAGEDLIVAALIRARCLTRGLKESEQLYCEIGAYHPIVTSGTHLLSQTFGMRGVLVDANEKRLAELRKGRPADTIVYAAITDSDRDTVQFTVSKSEGLSSMDDRWVQIWTERGGGVDQRIDVPAMHINRFFEKYFPRQKPMFLSIDVEGMDLALLQALDWRAHRPDIVQAEAVDFYMPGNTEAMSALMHGAGYSLTAKTDSNLIFVDTSA